MVIKYLGCLVFNIEVKNSSIKCCSLSSVLINFRFYSVFFFKEQNILNQGLEQS